MRNTGGGNGGLFRWFVLSLAATFLCSVFSCAGFSSAPPLSPPAFRYSSSKAVYTLWMPIAANSPIDTGGPVNSYSVDRALPTGLRLDPSTGVITGTPTTVASTAAYTVVAFNEVGSISTIVEITISQSQAPLSFTLSSISPPTSSQQGWATDGTYNYTFDTAVIYKRNNDLKWSEVTSNTSPFLGLTPGITHLGDGEYYNGNIYLPAENWGYAGRCTFRYQTLAVYSATEAGLPLVNSSNISADGHEVSGVAVVPAQNALYVSSFCDGSKLWIYDLNSLALIGTLPLSLNVPYIQGVSYNPATNSLFMTADTRSGGEIYQVSFTGIVTPVYTITIPAEVEGLDYTQASLGYMVDKKVYLLENSADPNQ
jgi:hypothetical protein